MSLQSPFAGSKYLLYRFSGYAVSDYDDPFPKDNRLVSNQIGMEFEYGEESIRYGYGLLCGYALPNKLNPLANIGMVFLLPAESYEYYLGAKFETALFYKFFFERSETPYLYQKRSWIDYGLRANLGMKVHRKIRLDGQISYPLHIFSLGIGYGL